MIDCLKILSDVQLIKMSHLHLLLLLQSHLLLLHLLIINEN